MPTVFAAAAPTSAPAPVQPGFAKAFLPAGASAIGLTLMMTVVAFTRVASTMVA